MSYLQKKFMEGVRQIETVIEVIKEKGGSEEEINRRKKSEG